MVTAKQRLDFVLKNFDLVYKAEQNSEVMLDYGQSIDNKVFVPDFSNGYFDSKHSLDNICIQWIVYKEEQIPLLFAKQDCETAYSIDENKIVFNFDIVSALFFFLSGWQETVVEKTDLLGRFTFKESIQKKLNISSLPVVNYYYLLLKEALELAYKIKFENQLHGENEFITCVTHDIDYWDTLWRKELKYALRKFDIQQVTSLLLGSFNSDKHQKSFKRIEEWQKKYDFKSMFFFLPDPSKYKGHENADYEVLNFRNALVIRQISENNAVGLHGSFGSSNAFEKLQSDKNKLSESNGNRLVSTNRFHFLMFDVQKIPALLEKAGIEIDSTLGFNDMPGFRFSTSYPFYLFDYEQNKASQVIEVPLQIMDASLFYGHYLGCKSMEEAWNYIELIVLQIKKTGGCLVLNWHNDAFADLGREVWLETLDAILKFCKANKSLFCNLEEVEISCRIVFRDSA